MKTFVAVLANGAAAIALLGVFWLAAASIELAARLEAARGAAAYERGTLVVGKVERESFTRKGGTSSYHCFAEGPVDGVPERLTLHDCTVDGGRVSTAQAAVGERIDVLVNRTISPYGAAAARRTLRYRTDLEAHLWQRVRDFLPLAYAPLVVPVAFALLMWLVARLAYGRNDGRWSLWVLAVGLGLHAAVLGIYAAM